MNQIESLLKKIENRTYTVGIVGLGYVGLPLMWTFHKNDMPVLGFDIDTKKVENLKNGIPYIKHLGTEMMEALANSDKADATTDFSRLDEADAILLCVPTPLDHYREPDMSYVEQTTETVSQYLRKGQLVILESTTWPESPALRIMNLLKKNGAEVSYYYPYLPAIPKNRDFAGWTGTTSVEWSKATISSFDATIISTDHSNINYSELADWRECVL